MAKVDLYPLFRKLLKLLNSARVEYLVVGGYAVVYHGYYRATDDMDLFVAVSEANARRLAGVLHEWGYSEDEVQPEMFLKRSALIVFSKEPTRVDILTDVAGLNFADCYPRRRIVDMDGIKVPFVSLEDLRKNKASTGRTKDLADLENLPLKPLPDPSKRKPKKRKRS